MKDTTTQVNILRGLGEGTLSDTLSPISLTSRRIDLRSSSVDGFNLALE